MARASSAVERGPDEVSSGELPPGVLTSGGRPGGEQLQVVQVPGCTPEGGTPPIGELRLVLVTASGFEVPLVTSPEQAARLLRCASETDVVDLRGAEDPGRQARGVCGPRPVPVARLLSRGHLVNRSATPVEGGAA